MTTIRKTAIVTGASQGIGAGIANLFLERGYNVVANSRHITRKHELRSSDRLALVDGDIALPTTAQALVDTATTRFGSLDVLINNAGIFISKPFTSYTVDEFHALASTNIEGFLHITQRAVATMIGEKARGSIVNITASIAEHPLLALPASVAMITKGGINAITRSLALEYAKHGIRFNAVAPGVVETPLLAGVPKEFLQSLSPLSTVATTDDVAEATLYLAEAQQVTGEILRVNGGSHIGQW